MAVDASSLWHVFGYLSGLPAYQQRGSSTSKASGGVPTGTVMTCCLLEHGHSHLFPYCSASNPASASVPVLRLQTSTSCTDVGLRYLRALFTESIISATIITASRRSQLFLVQGHCEHHCWMRADSYELFGVRVVVSHFRTQSRPSQRSAQALSVGMPQFQHPRIWLWFPLQCCA